MTHMHEILSTPLKLITRLSLYRLTANKSSWFWKFNSSLLDDEGFTSAIRESLSVFKDKYADLDDLQSWTK